MAIDDMAGPEEMRPPAELAEFAVSVWQRRFSPSRGVHVQPVLADGCLDLMCIDDGPLCLVGPETSRADGLIPGGARLVGIRLRPGVGARLFGPVVRELVDGSAALVDLPPLSGQSRGRASFVEAPSDAHRRLLDALLPRAAAAAPDDGVAFGVAWLARHPGATVDDLCARLGWSPREVRRRFVAALGFGPKLMQRMIRFQRALYLAARADPRRRPALSELAHACGYADQAHMTREFRTLAHATPGVLLAGPFDPTLGALLETSCGGVDARTPARHASAGWRDGP